MAFARVYSGGRYAHCNCVRYLRRSHYWFTLFELAVASRRAGQRGGCWMLYHLGRCDVVYGFRLRKTASRYLAQCLDRNVVDLVLWTGSARAWLFSRCVRISVRPTEEAASSLIGMTHEASCGVSDVVMAGTSHSVSNA